ncbi:MAG: hypothetical protein SAK29_33170 [Scytonema sp. PMC 1069.18]|nr:hypothetical protein [Scytonema sp. PMC 1069.18]MEC4887288.1 hypothetical protein [Scytonema sp. PMC 1070.18]
MSRRRYPPAYLRYLKARLWNLARPGFWGTALFLSVVGLVIKEYWARPDFLTQHDKSEITSKKTNQPINSSLTPEDKAIAADIDNLPLLFPESESESVPLANSSPNQNDQSKKETGLLEELVNKNDAAKNGTQIKSDVTNSSTTQKLENPFLEQADKLLQLNSQSGSQFLGNNTPTPRFSQQGVAQTSLNFGTESSSGLNSAQNALLESPLQTALDRSVGRNQSIFTSNASTQTDSIRTSLNNESAQTLTPTSTEISTGASTPLSTGTGYAQPSAINLLPQNSISTSGYTQPGQTNLFPSQYPNFGTGYTQTGQINTQLQTPISGTNYVQPGQTNLLQNPVSNTQPGQINQLSPNSTPTTGYVQPTPLQTNPLQNTNPNSDRRFGFGLFRNRDRNTQVSPNVSQPAPIVSPSTAAPLTNPSPYYAPIPNPGAVNYTTPVAPTTYGNSSIQQPTQPPQYNYSSTPQIPAQPSSQNQQRNYWNPF